MSINRSNSKIKIKFWFGPEIVDAAAVGDLEAIRRLLKGSSSPNEKNQLGGCPLSVACQYNHFDAVKVLLENPETDPNLPDLNGETALMKASEEGHMKVVNLLLGDKKRKIKIRAEMQDKDGWTALFFVKNLGISKKLLKRMDSHALNLRDKDGDTAFMVHVGKGRVKMVETMLKQKGIELRFRNSKGQNALDIAKKKARTKLVTLLEKEMKKRYPQGLISPLQTPRLSNPCRSPTMSPTKSPLKSPFAGIPLAPEIDDFDLAFRPSRTPSLSARGFSVEGVAPNKVSPKKPEAPKWEVVVIKVKEDKRKPEPPIKLGKPNIGRLRQREPLHWDAHDPELEWASDSEEEARAAATPKDEGVVLPSLADDEEEVDWGHAVQAARKKRKKKRSKKKAAVPSNPPAFLPPSLQFPVAVAVA